MSKIDFSADYENQAHLAQYEDEDAFYAELKGIQELSHIRELRGRIPEFIGAVDKLPEALSGVGLSSRGIYDFGIVLSVLDGQPLEKVWNSFDEQTMDMVYESAKEIMTILNAYGYAHGDPFGRNFVVDFPETRGSFDQGISGASGWPFVKVVDFTNIRYKKHLGIEVLWDEEMEREWRKFEYLRYRTTALEVCEAAGRDFGVPWGLTILPMPARDLIYRRLT